MRYFYKFIKPSFLLLIFIFAGLILSACNPLDSKMKTGLQVISPDNEMNVFLDGELLGKTPYINKKLKEGEYLLKLEPINPSLVGYETSISLNKGLLTVITWNPSETLKTSSGVIYELSPINNKKTAEVSFISIPDTTMIKLDEQAKQFAPLIISDLEPGHHQFEASLPSYQSQSHVINLIAGHRLNIHLKLAKSLDNEIVSSPTPTDISPESSASATATTSGQLNASPSAMLSRDEFLAVTASPSGQTVDGDKVKILSTDFFIDGEEVLKVREQANSSSKELGLAKVGHEYAYLGEESNGWYQINFDNQTAWVSAKYCQLILE